MIDNMLPDVIEQLIVQNEQTNKLLKDILEEHKKKYHSYRQTYHGTCEICGVHQGLHP